MRTLIKLIGAAINLLRPIWFLFGDTKPRREL